MRMEKILRVNIDFSYTSSDENRIWDALNEELAARGENIKVEYIIVELAVANRAVADGEVDLNSFLSLYR